MKKLLIPIILLFLFTGCEKNDCDTYPPAPYGTYDDINYYESSGYKSVTYTYYCYKGNYRSITYSNYDCEGWEKSEFTSSCI